MAFRSDEAAEKGRENAIEVLATRNFRGSDRARSESRVHDLIDQYGPVVDAYPHWHPLVSSGKRGDLYPVTHPGKSAGYDGLDHTIYFRNAFITCPYSDGKKVLDSVARLNSNPAATIEAEIIDTPLYVPDATPILVKCNWDRPMENDGTIRKPVAVALLLEMEIPKWWNSEVAETWETMRPYFLGSPRGSRSSLFVNQETGQTFKNLWNMLIHTGMFGPIYVG